MWTNVVQPNVLSGKVFVSILRCGNLCESMDSGDLKVKVRLGRRLMRNTVVKMTSPHKYWGTFIVNIRAQATLGLVSIENPTFGMFQIKF